MRGTHIADLLLEEADDLPLALHHLDVEVDHGPGEPGSGSSQSPAGAGGGRGGVGPSSRTHSSRADTR